MRFRRAVRVRRTRWVNRGSSVDTARSMRATFILISAAGDIGTGFCSSFLFSLDVLSSTGFISTSVMADSGYGER